MTTAPVDFTTKHHLPAGKKFLHVIGYAIITVAICLILLIIFWLVYPYETVEVKTPVEILNEKTEIAPGEPIVMELNIVKSTNLAPQSTQFILCSDGSLTFTDPGTPRNLPPGEYRVISDTNLLPAKLIPGSRCTYNFRNSYRVNPVRDITNEWSSEQFLVVRR